MLHFIYLYLQPLLALSFEAEGEKKMILIEEGISESSNKYEFTIRDKLQRPISFMTGAYATIRAYTHTNPKLSFFFFYLVLLCNSYIFILFLLLSAIKLDMEVSYKYN